MCIRDRPYFNTRSRLRNRPTFRVYGILLKCFITLGRGWSLWPLHEVTPPLKTIRWISSHQGIRTKLFYSTQLCYLRKAFTLDLADAQIAYNYTGSWRLGWHTCYMFGNLDKDYQKCGLPINKTEYTVVCHWQHTHTHTYIIIIELYWWFRLVIRHTLVCQFYNLPSVLPFILFILVLNSIIIFCYLFIYLECFNCGLNEFVN